MEEIAHADAGAGILACISIRRGYSHRNVYRIVTGPEGDAGKDIPEADSVTEGGVAIHRNRALAGRDLYGTCIALDERHSLLVNRTRDIGHSERAVLIGAYDLRRTVNGAETLGRDARYLITSELETGKAYGRGLGSRDSRNGNGNQQ